jgi:AAA family ATP:ADP antiporter
LKDSLVVTASGAEVIPFIKVWVMLPTAILLTFAFTRLSHRYSQERVFYIMITLFLSVFALFAYVLYPLRDLLHPTATAAVMQEVLPAGFKGLIAMCCNWTFTGFYVMCELWSTSIMSVLFWGFANEVTKISEARRFYGVLGVGASFAATAAGQSANFLSQGGVFNPALPFGRDAWEQMLVILITGVIISGLATMGIFRWMSKNVLKDPCFDEFHHARKVTKLKKRLSMRESFAYLSTSKYLMCIAVLVVSYNLMIHMVEVVWKDQLARLYPSPSDYNIYMNNVTSLIGVFATITALFMPKIFSRLGWTGAAAITPIMMLVTSIGFFSFLCFQEQWSGTFTVLLGTTPLAIAVFFGSAQNCLSKAAKYSVFDSTKEMAFIPLSHDSKLKGKAAIDGVGSRIGKCGGSLIHQGLLMGLSTVSASAPYVAVITLVVVFGWLLVTKSLGKQFNELAAQSGDKPLDPPAPKAEQWAPAKTQTASA